MSTFCPAHTLKFDRDAVTIVTETLQNGQQEELHAVRDDPQGPCWGSKPQLARSRVPRYTGAIVRKDENHVRTTCVASKRGLAGTVLVVLVVQPPV